ncbi:MAG: transcriptional repressor [Candidatus Eisenbacteria bacterium]|nr:transcriptional repressor [Candidatus Eisenbacteria bacterium]MCC7141457.1 transcriptional repressor [Candidatus Eisenbacteria bacterium]
MNEAVVTILQGNGIQPSAQRVAVGEYVLRTEDHPSADQVWAAVRERFPMISRATVYNTLNLFVEKKLLRELILAEGRIVFDPNLGPHHHFIDEESGAILDVPWDAVSVDRVETLPGMDVREYQVVMRGRRRAH